VWKEVVLSGNHYELGYQHGAQLRETILKNIQTNMLINAYYTGLTPNKMSEAATKYLRFLKTKYKHFYEEIRGLSDGSGADIVDIMLLNLHGRDTLGACTLFAVPSELTEDGRALIGQSVDWSPLLDGDYVVLKIHDEEHDLTTTMFTEAGIIGLVGKNGKGVGECMSLLLTDRNSVEGLPAYLVLRNVLEQKRIGDALNAVLNAPRASAFNYLIGDDSGEIYDVEADPDNHELFYVEDKVFVHTNHILGKMLFNADKYVEASNSCETIHRCNRAKKLLNQCLAKGKIGIKDVMVVMRDHANFPDSVCRHPSEGVSAEGQFKTVAAIVMKQGEQSFWVTQGNPCENEFYKVTL
jgi:isopenicillin-N N-acyltransferase-like protein